jgi:hypothetical protein
MTTRKPTQRKSLSQTKHDNATAMNFYAAMADKPKVDVPKVITRGIKTVDQFYSEMVKVLSYDPETGLFTRITTYSNRAKEYGKVGYTSIRGYIVMNLFGEKHYAHRLAWLYVNKRWPNGEIDHINGNKSDNRLCNLREATSSQNMSNRGVQSNSKSGVKGVVLDEKSGKWQAYCRVNKRSKYLGIFDTKEAAAAAYDEYAKIHHGDFFLPAKQDEPLEHAEQVAVIDWWFHYSRSIQLHPNLLVACPNAQMLIAHANNPNAALMYLRREGMRPGALDLTLYVARSPWHGLLIEMKRRTKGTVSADQQAMADTIAGQGYRCILARGADDAIAQIKNYLGR